MIKGQFDSRFLLIVLYEQYYYYYYVKFITFFLLQ